jgi:hypothetical protein
MLLRLSPTAYQRLVEVAHTTHAPRALHRAQALLWLHDGDTVEEVATRLFVAPRTVFRWCRHFHERQCLTLPARAWIMGWATCLNEPPPKCAATSNRG